MTDINTTKIIQDDVWIDRLQLQSKFDKDEIWQNSFCQNWVYYDALGIIG